MSTLAGAPKPTDLAWPGLTPDDLCMSMDEGMLGEVRDASRCTRGQAIAFYASEAGCSFTEVRCVVRYALLYTRQDVWDGPGRDRWADDHVADSWGKVSVAEAFATAPTEPPTNWRPDEYMPCWEFCERTHPRAVRVYCLEQKGDGMIERMDRALAARKGSPASEGER